MTHQDPDKKPQKTFLGMGVIMGLGIFAVLMACFWFTRGARQREVARFLEVAERVEVVVELRHGRGTEQRGGDRRVALVAQHPGDRHLGQRLAAFLGDVVERTQVAEVLLVEEVLVQRLAGRGP